MTLKEKEAVALVCLEAQHVAGLPAAAEGRQILLRLLHQHHETTVAARCSSAGVAAFHDQVLLLHCAPVDRITSVAVTVIISYDHLHHHNTVSVDLAAQLLNRPSPVVLSLVLGGAGVVLSLTLHHRLIIRHPHRRCSSCLPLPILLNCLRTWIPTGPLVTADDRNKEDGFITIDKGIISRRRPPSDNLLTTDDEGDYDAKPTRYYPPMALLAEQLQVENEFLAKLEADHHISCNIDHLDALIKDAEAELAAVDKLFL